jgi:hypothetical protein
MRYARPVTWRPDTLTLTPEIIKRRTPRSSIVTSDIEALIAQHRHTFDLIVSHRAKGVFFMILAAVCRTHTVAVTPKIGYHHMEAFCQKLGEPVPTGVCLWISVK